MTSLGADVSDHRLERPDGRIVAWAEAGVPDGRPVLRVPGTPGSRLSFRADRRPWLERGLRVISTERPGFGASSRLEGRGFDAPADDLAAILDAVGVERVPVYGGSGASPHILAFAARHPDRVAAATIAVGAAPMDDDEAANQIDANALEYRLYQEGRLDEIWQLVVDMRDAILADPLAGFREIMASSTDADRAIIEDPEWQRGFEVGIRESLRAGPGGWYDEGIATLAPWEIDLTAVRCSLTWWHSDGDRNCPLSAAQRLVGAIAGAEISRVAGRRPPHALPPRIRDARRVARPGLILSAAEEVISM